LYVNEANANLVKLNQRPPFDFLQIAQKSNK